MLCKRVLEMGMPVQLSKAFSQGNMFFNCRMLVWKKQHHMFTEEGVNRCNLVIRRLGKVEAPYFSSERPGNAVYIPILIYHFYLFSDLFSVIVPRVD